MVTLEENESALISELLDCLREAASDLPDIDIDYANKTKVQKSLYFAIDEYDLPVTYSWYLAGAVVPDKSIGPEALESPGPTTDGPVSPDSPGQSTEESGEQDSEPGAIDPVLFTDDTADGGVDAPDDLSTYVPRESVVEYFKTVLPEVWHEHTMRFLQNFYQETAPEEYRLLYIESTHLRTHLREIEEAIQSQVDGTDPDQSISSLRESAELSVSDLHYYIRQSETLSETFEVVVEGTDLIEDALLKLDQKSSEDYVQEDVAAMEKLQDFFYYCVWKYPCLLISRETASGPSADQLRADRVAEYTDFETTVRERRSELEADLQAADLVPSPGDYPTVENTEMAETLNDLSSEYLE